MNNAGINPLTRREALTRSMGGLGSVVLSWMLHQDSLQAAETGPAGGVYNLLPRAPHFPAKARSVIFLCMPGGPSQVDLLDPKPALTKFDNKESPIEVVSRRGVKAKLMGSPFKFAKYGQSGIEVSELLPALASVIDDVAVIRSGVTERVDHDTATCHWLSGRNTTGYPTFGAWVVYGLGTQNQNLPAYIALQEVQQLRKFSSGWLPPIFGGTLMEPEGIPIADLQRPSSMTPGDERSIIDMVNGLNRLDQKRHPEVLELDTRIANFEIAARMQVEAMKKVDFSAESEDTKRLYGLDKDDTRPSGLRCLLARRLVESGVRFVQVTLGSWDHHSNLTASLRKSCLETDGPISGLIKDLKQRGLLDSTLLVWGGEFGRLPTVEKADGRDHNPHGFTVWMAGGGIKGGQIYGATDEVGFAAAEKPVSHSDMHATILHLLGIDVSRLTYDYDGRVETLIGVNPARVLKELVA